MPTIAAEIVYDTNLGVVIVSGAVAAEFAALPEGERGRLIYQAWRAASESRRGEAIRSPEFVDIILSRVSDSEKEVGWCHATDGCACSGCVNKSASARMHVLLEAEWEDWKRRHAYCPFCRRHA